MSVSPQVIKSEIQAKNWSGARADLLTYTQEHPKDAIAWYYLAQVDGKVNNLAEARDAMRQADLIDPRHAYVGNMLAYNELQAKLNAAQNPHPVQTQPVAHTAIAQVPVQPPAKDNTGLWVGLVVSLLVIVFISWMIGAHNARKRREREEAQRELDRQEAKREREEQRRIWERMSDNAVAQQRNVDTARQTHASPSFGAAYGGNTQVPPPAPKPAYADYYRGAPPVQAPAPVTVVNNGGGMGGGYYGHNDGMLTGLILGEMISDNHHDHYVERERYSAPAPAPAPAPSPSFDWGSSSSSSSSDSSSSFDFGSSGGSDWSSGGDSGW